MTLAEAVAEQLVVARELIRIPSVSLPGFDPSYVDASAELTREALVRVGVEHTEIVSVEGGRPAVIGSRTVDPQAPTVLLYAHHDVMPADAERWTSSPFAPQVRDGRLYGRGAADDKCGLAVHLAALQHLGDALPVNVRVLVEGEEEAGSPTIAALLDAHADTLAADVAIVTDGVNAAPLRPTLGTSFRGMLDVEVEIETGTISAHSGIWGGVVPDALMVLARVLDSLHDEHGDVAVSGLRTTPGDDPDTDIDGRTLTAATGLLAGVRPIGTARTRAAQLWARPAITTIGIDAPSVAESSNRLCGRARARLNVRLAPGDDVSNAWGALRRHVTGVVPFGAHAQVRLRGSGEPFRDRGRVDVMGLARRRLSSAFQAPCMTAGCGGSIPLLTELQQRTRWHTVLVTAVADPMSNSHGEDESVDLQAVDRAAAAEAAVLAEFPGR